MAHELACGGVRVLLRAVVVGLVGLVFALVGRKVAVLQVTVPLDGVGDVAKQLGYVRVNPSASG